MKISKKIIRSHVFKIFISFQISKMIIYFSLFIPLLFLSTDSSSIRNRSNKNELVPFLNSRVGSLKTDSNSLKIVSNEPFIIQLQMPNSREREAKKALEKYKRRKRPLKKKISKVKPLRKKHRTRRELLNSKTKIREQKSYQSDMPQAVTLTEQQLTNLTKNSINRMEILKALSSHSKKVDNKRNKFEDIKNSEKVKHNAPSRNRDFSLSDRTSHVKMVYPSTPKPDQHRHKYTYKDLMADRERLEQKIRYIKNMLNVSDSATDDAVRVRRRSDSDRTANKIAKIFLTLSAVNGLHDRRKSKCREDDEEEGRVQDDWEKERRNNPTRKSSSSNEERYKVKKWIEYMKNKRSSGKTCPCTANENDEESETFPLEQKLPKGYFLRGRSSEESYESFSDPFYYSRDKLNSNNLKNRFEKFQEQENKLKALAKNGKKKLELPFDDLEIYRSRAKQILQNAEEILDRIKEEEEKRLHSPNILMSQLKELTSRIQTDPRNNENDLIRKIQKNLGWSTLAKSEKETGDSTFIDNVKSFILDPYEKAKALTDESTKKLSSYLLRNLGKLQESSEEQEEDNQETARKHSQVYFEQIPQKEEEKPVSANLAKEDLTTKVSPKEKEDLKNDEDILQVNLNDNDDVNNKSNQEEIFKQRVEDVIKKQQKKVSDYKVRQNSKENSQEIDSFDQKNEKVAKTAIETTGESESEKNLENEDVAAELNVKEKKNNENDEEKTEKLMNSESKKQAETEKAANSSEEGALKKISENSDFVEKKKKLKTDETSQEEKDQTDVTASENVPVQEEFEEEAKKGMKAHYEKVKHDKLDLVKGDQEIINTEEQKKEENAKNEDKTLQVLEEQKLGRKRENEEDQNHKEEFEKAETINAQEIRSGENAGELKIARQKEGEENILLSPHYLFYDYDNEDSKAPFETDENLKAKAIFDEISDETKSSKETILRKQENAETETKEEDSARKVLGENNFMSENIKELLDPSQNGKENVNLKESFNKILVQKQKELSEGNEKQDPSNEETPETGIQYKDPVRGSVHEYKNFFESNHSKNTVSDLKSDDHSKEDQEKAEKNEDQKLAIENPDDEINQAGEDEGEKKKADVSIQKEILENSEKLEKKLDENSNKDLSKSEKSIRQSQESFDEANENDNQLQAVKFENFLTTEKSISDETFLKNVLENTNQYDNENDDTKVEAKKPTEQMSNESLYQSKNEDVNTEIPLEKENKNNEETKKKEILLRTALNKQSAEKDLNVEEVDETTLKETLSKEYKDKEINETLTYSNEENSSETFLKSREEEGTDSESSVKATNPSQDINESNDGEAEDKEISDKIFSDNLQKNEESGQQNTLKSERLIDNSKSQEGNDKDYSNVTTLREVINEKEKENFKKTDEETISMVKSKDKEADRINENDEKETTFSLEKTQPEYLDKNESSLSSEEQDILKKEKSEEINLKGETSDEKNQDNQSRENSEEKDNEKTLKASLNEQNQENLKIKNSNNEEQDQDRKSKEESTIETLKEVTIQETEENLNESPDDEILTAKVKEELEQSRDNDDENETHLKSTLKYNDQKSTEGADDEETLKESEQRQDNFSKEVYAEKILEQATEMNDDKTERKLSENKSSQDEENLEEANVEDSLLKITNPGEFKNNKEMDRDNRSSSENDRSEISLESAVESTQEKKETHSDETIRAENLEDDQEKGMLSRKGDGTPLKTASSENEVDNKIENEETLLKSEKVDEEKSSAELVQIGRDESEEILREKNIADDLSNQIDQEYEDENPLRSKHSDETNEVSGKNSHEESYETLTARKPSAENLSAEDYESQAETSVNHDLPNSEEQNHSSISDLTEKTDSTKIDKLKVPTSIGKIMKALEGKEKDDITSFRNLNPNKIDDIIDKIDEAEQKNLKQSLEVDCRKECACAEEIDTKSRNIGRYEIVKDFLFWMKDLQLHRVLSDD